MLAGSGGQGHQNKHYFGVENFNALTKFERDNTQLSLSTVYLSIIQS